jgi:hypothetical protein
VPALAELREQPREERVQAPIVERPARPPDRLRRPSAGSVVLVVIGLAFAGVAALAFVPQSHGPSFVKAPVDQAAPAVPVRPRQPRPWSRMGAEAHAPRADGEAEEER